MGLEGGRDSETLVLVLVNCWVLVKLFDATGREEFYFVLLPCLV